MTGPRGRRRSVPRRVASSAWRLFRFAMALAGLALVTAGRLVVVIGATVRYVALRRDQRGVRSNGRTLRKHRR